MQKVLEKDHTENSLTRLSASVLPSLTTKKKAGGEGNHPERSPSECQLSSSGDQNSRELSFSLKDSWGGGALQLAYWTRIGKTLAQISVVKPTSIPILSFIYLTEYCEYKKEGIPMHTPS